MSTIKIQQNIPLSRYTTFKIGGEARWFCEVRNENELEEAIKYAKDQKIAAFIMGGGSNLVVSDKGFDGLVIKIAPNSDGSQPKVKMRMENRNFFIECWAGESFSSIVKLATDGALSGLEWAAGIPGSLGGAVRGNAGAFGGSISDNIESVRVLKLSDSQIIINDADPNYKLPINNYENAECQFSYRDSIFKQKDNLVITSVVLKLGKGNKNEIEAKIKEILAKRKEKQPHLASPGSYFENPIVENNQLIEKFEHDCNTKCRDSKIPAGWLIDEVGLRGKKMGNIQVSNEHANFLVNLGGGKAEEVVMLASLIKQRARDELGVELHEEVKYVGF
ncbi:MAG: UDP-N-acetylmuramate dehydrogenase [Parcubacteria group bacterium]|jgi:UDP-N-acetylmuramate dehydrogenase